MTTPETRARLGALERQLATPTPAPLTGQTALPVPDRTGAAMPTRIQRRRTRGWTKPANCVIVDRTSRFGNPLRIDAIMDVLDYTEDQARDTVVAEFGKWLAGSRSFIATTEADKARERILANLPDLVGKDLACTCALDRKCHADILLTWAADPNLHNRIAAARGVVDQLRANHGLDPMRELAAAA